MYHGIEPKLKAVREVFDFVDAVCRVHYPEAYAKWQKPSAERLREAVESLLGVHPAP